jgi:hypothetical protein
LTKPQHDGTTWHHGADLPPLRGGHAYHRIHHRGRFPSSLRIGRRGALAIAILIMERLTLGSGYGFPIRQLRRIAMITFSRWRRRCVAFVAELSLALVVMAGGTAPAGAAEPTWSTQDLGTLGGGWS